MSGSVRDVCMSHQSDWIYHISCCKGKWYVRRFDPDKVENGHIHSSVKEEEVFIYRGLPLQFLWVRLRSLWAVLIVISNWIISQRNIVFGI